MFEVANCDLKLLFSLGESLEHEIRGESLAVALYLFIQALYRHVVEFCQSRIENDPLMAQNQDTKINRDHSRFSVAAN